MRNYEIPWGWVVIGCVVAAIFLFGVHASGATNECGGFLG